MKPLTCLAVLLMCGSCLAFAQHKKNKPEVFALFGTAHYVYVQTDNGDVDNPRLFPEDRRAIADVEDGIRNWNRYSLTIDRSQADLIIVLRRGNLASSPGRGGVSAGQGPRPISPSGSGRDPSQNQGTAGDGIGAGAEAEVGPDTDVLRVYGSSGGGKRFGPIWTGEQTDGLESPDVPLFRQLKAAVDRAYPNPPQQPTKP